MVCLALQMRDGGYNVLWFHPIVGLRKIFGSSFTAVRIFFFALCTLTAFLGYGTVYRATGRTWLALGASVPFLFVAALRRLGSRSPSSG